MLEERLTWLWLALEERRVELEEPDERLTCEEALRVEAEELLREVEDEGRLVDEDERAEELLLREEEELLLV